jgi:hypothetical protein
MHRDSLLLLEKIQGVNNDFSQCGNCEERKPVNGAAGEEIGFALFQCIVAASSHGKIDSVISAETEAEPLRRRYQAEPGNENNVDGVLRVLYF